MDNNFDEFEQSGLIPEGTNVGGRVIGEPFSSQGARGAAAIETQHNSALREARDSGRAVIALPNGEYGFLDEDEEFIGDHSYLAGQHKSLFADAAKLLSDPKPGYMYVWAAKYSPRGDKANAQTLAAIRSGRYEPVSCEEVHQETDLPIEDHVIGGYHCAGIVDVLLMAVTPQAQKMMYRWRTFEAKRRTNRFQAFEELKGKVSDASRGQAHAELEIRD